MNLGEFLFGRMRLFLGLGGIAFPEGALLLARICLQLSLTPSSIGISCGHARRSLCVPARCDFGAEFGQLLPQLLRDNFGRRRRDKGTGAEARLVIVDLVKPNREVAGELQCLKCIRASSVVLMHRLIALATEQVENICCLSRKDRTPS